MPDKVAVAADHGGFDLKTALLPELKSLGLEPLDLGTDSAESVDYPDYAEKVARAVEEGRVKWGVLICGTGIGMTIAANRHKGVRAALVHDVRTARLAREHNDANVLALGGRVLDLATAKDCVRNFFSAKFEGGRHARRVAKLSPTKVHP
jgi:ribose 5-phosphate isomerase B